MTYQPPPPQYAYRPPPPQPMSPGGQPLADFGTRLLAYLIDSAIVTGVLMIVFVPVLLVVAFGMMDELMAAAPTDGGLPPGFGAFVWKMILLEIALVVAMLVAYYFYYVELLFRTGRTVGKKAMKLRVVPLDPQARLTRGMAAKRYLVHIVAGSLLPFFSYVDGLWQLWDKPYLQTLHDKFAQTVVVKVAP